jgi:hypothetical protein
MKFEYTNDTKHITGFTRYDDEKKSAVFKYVWTDNVAQIVAYDASGTTKTGHYRIEEYDSYDSLGYGLSVRIMPRLIQTHHQRLAMRVSGCTIGYRQHHSAFQMEDDW